MRIVNPKNRKRLGHFFERVCHKSMTHPLSLINSSLYYFLPSKGQQHTFAVDD